MTMMVSAPAQPTIPSAGTDLFRGFSSLGSRLTDRLGAGALGANVENLISGVKNFLPANKDLTLTKITESIMDPRSANARGTMPNASQIRQQGGVGAMGSGTQASFGQRRQGYSEAIVFTVGGGSIDEYGNLQEWAKRTSQAQSGGAVGAPRKRVVYGSTDLINAEDFIKLELTKLGHESS